MPLLIDTKPTLEWVYDSIKKRWFAKTPFGTYEVEGGVGGFTASFMDVWCSLEFEEEWEAKAAAQADYERRTADRFAKVQIPSTDQIENGSMDYAEGYEDAISDLKFNIKTALDRAKKEKL